MIKPNNTREQEKVKMINAQDLSEVFEVQILGGPVWYGKRLPATMKPDTSVDEAVRKVIIGSYGK